MSSHDPLIQELILRNGDNIFATKTEPSLFQSVVSLLESTQQISAMALKKQLIF